MRAAMACLFLSLGLAGCSSGDEEASLGTTLSKAAIGAVKSRASRSAAPDPAAQAAGMAQAIASAPGPVLLVAVPSRDTVAVVGPLSQNGDVTTWASQDGLTLSTRDGIVIATRGFGDDLLSADVAATLSALRSGGGQVTKTISLFATGEAASRKQAFTCTISAGASETLQILNQSVTARRYDEACRASGANFNNAYWIKSGKVVQSSQWISPTVKSLAIQSIK